MNLSESGTQILKELEGYRATPYSDATGYSIGFGHFIKAGETFTYLSYQDALKVLKKDLSIFENNIRTKILIPLNQNQFDALVIWNYNTGRTTSSLFDLINKKASLEEIIKFWTTTYITSNGEALEALVKRRAIEANLFASAMLKDSKTTILPILFTALAAIFFFSKKVGIK